MKSLVPSIAAMLLGLASPVFAEAPPASGVEPPHIAHEVLPGFPFEMLQLGAREGEVRIAFALDAKGRLDDCLPIAYTNRAFADASVAALHEWTFRPAHYDGAPISSVAEIDFHFEVSGTTVVSLTASEELGALLYPITQGDSAFRCYELKELDRIPTPISVTPPAYPRSLAEAGRTGSVTITFFIDESGAVRLPAAAPGDDPALGALAINALGTWKFEPPTHGGHAVLARATQEFRFKPPTNPAGEPAGAAEKR